MKFLTKLAASSINAFLACAMLCSPAFSQTRTHVTIIDFGSANDSNGTFEDVNGDALPAGQNVPYLETIPRIAFGDTAPVAFNGFSPNDINPFNVVVGADPALADQDPADPNYVTPEIEALELNGGATLEWTNVTSWNSNAAAGNAGDNYFAAVDGLGPTTFTITTADPTDTVQVEAIGSSQRDALVTFNGRSNYTDVYVPGISYWTNIGRSRGTASGSLAVGFVPGGGAAEGNVGAFRITIYEDFTVKGDVDRDGQVIFLDIFPLIQVLAANEFQPEADCNCDGAVNFLDIEPWLCILTIK